MPIMSCRHIFVFFFQQSNLIPQKIRLDQTLLVQFFFQGTTHLTRRQPSTNLVFVHQFHVQHGEKKK
jgi:hypothetical protein